ncbi:hypothetical protein BC831DRAFT_211576 [Entophlyctis helioformis]|nr:hypothetical protein BC831DRAFT_211576 [Entophlyctis helioformis]
MADDKRAERLFKKAKPFLDEKLKPKQRLKSLVTFLESSTEPDQVKFFQEHDYTIYTVMFECFSYRVSRIREKAERTFSAANKDVADLMETLGIFARVLKHSKSKLRQGWQARSIIGMLELLLATGNHQRLRVEGLRLLLQYLASRDTEQKEYTDLFADAIDLSLFDTFPVPEPRDLANADGRQFVAFSAHSPASASATNGNQSTSAGIGVGAGVACISGSDSIATTNGNLGMAGVAGSTLAGAGFLNAEAATKSEGESDMGSKHAVLPDWIGDGRGTLGQKPIQAGKRAIHVSSAPDQGTGSETASLGNMDKVILYPSTAATRDEQCELFEEILRHISDLAIQLAMHVPESDYSSTALCTALAGEYGTSLKSIWSSFRQTYLRLLFPRPSRRCGLRVGDGEGFETCPPQILALLLRFLLRTVITKVTLGPESPPHEFAAAALVHVILSDEASREVAHEVVRQALLLPPAHFQTTRNALFLLSSWIFVDPDQRHDFLTGTPANGGMVLSNHQDQDDEDEDGPNKLDSSLSEHDGRSAIKPADAATNRHLRRYVLYLRLVFTDKHISVDEHDHQLVVFRDALDMMRAIAMEKHVVLETHSWEQLMLTMLDIQAFALHHPAQIQLTKACPAFVQSIAETVLITWLRSRLTKESLWKRLRADVTACTTWVEYIRTWADLMLKLTKIMADKVYDFDGSFGIAGHSHGHASGAGAGGNGANETAADMPLKSRAQRKTINSGKTRETLLVPGSAGSGAGGGRDGYFTRGVAGPTASPSLERVKKESHGGAEEDGSCTPSKERDPAATHKYLHDKAIQNAAGTGTVAAEQASDEDVSDCSVEHHMAHRQSKTFATLKDIEWWNAENSLWIWKSLLCVIGRIRDISTPAINCEATACIVHVWDALEKIRQSQKFENVGMPDLFDFSGILFEGASMSLEFIDSIIVAVGCVCRLMCRRHDQAVSQEHYTHFYRILQKWLPNAPTAIVSSILVNAQRIFTLCLPGSHILIPSILDSISGLAGKPDVSDDVSSAGIHILSSLTCMQSNYYPVQPNRDVPGEVGGMSGNARVSHLYHIPSLVPSARSTAANSPNISKPVFGDHLQLSDQPEASAAAESSQAGSAPQQLSSIESVIRTSASEVQRSQGAVHATPQVPEIVMDADETPAANDSTVSSISGRVNEPNALPERLPVFVGLKAKILQVIVKLITSFSTLSRDCKTPFVELLLWNIGIMAFDETRNVSIPDAVLVQDCIGVLLDHISLRKPRETRAAADCLSLFAQHHAMLKLEDDIAHHVIDRIIFAISENLQFEDRSRKQSIDIGASAMIVSVLFRCLVDWLSAVPHALMSNPNIALRVSEVIEEAMHATYTADASGNGAGPERAGSADCDSDAGAGHQQRGENALDEKEIGSLLKSIRSCAENALIHLLHHIDNFSPINGPAMMHSLISEPPIDDEEFDSHQFFTVGDHVVLSFSDTNQGSRCRIIMRDPTGKYVWDMRPFYRSLSEVEDMEGAPPPQIPTPQKPIGTAAGFKFNEHTAVTSSWDMPEEGDDQDNARSSFKGPDVLEQLLVSIGDKHPDCLKETETGKLNAPSLKLINERPGLSDISQAMRNQIHDEGISTYTFRQSFLEKASESRRGYMCAEPPTPKDVSALFQSARLLLGQMGFLAFDALKTGNFHLLSKTPSLIRDIKGLDRKYSREVAKVAVIYVAPGQEEEYSIFRNSCGSVEYEEFVSSLGWEVDLAKHPGYLGGLERSMVNGGVAPYYCTSTLEIMYHDVTKMPTDPADPKQLKKKRHIGNDHVHIIWNEHYRDYRWDTIGGDFGNAQIAITPLSNGMYAVDTYRDDTVRQFGPLQSRAVVSKAALGPLVRTTAMNAYRAALFSGQGRTFVEPHPFTSRKETIGIIASRHKMPAWTYERLSDQLFTNGREGRSAPAAAAAVAAVAAGPGPVETSSGTINAE